MNAYYMSIPYILYIPQSRTRMYIRTPLYKNVNRLVHRRLLRSVFFHIPYTQRAAETIPSATFERSVIDE